MTTPKQSVSETATTSTRVTGADRERRKREKGYLIKAGWSYTSRFPHRWRDPESKWPTSVSEAQYEIAEAVSIQTNRDGFSAALLLPAISPMDLSSVAMAAVDKVDREFEDAGLDAFSPERMAVDRVKSTIQEDLGLASGRRRAGALGTRKNEYKARAALSQE